jgi:GGDEF domain-containing protein/CHASE3 domain sensor protein
VFKDHEFYLQKAPEMKLTISRKLLLIYFFMALLTVLSSTYAIISLYRINNLAFNLANRDFSLLNASKQMTNVLLDLENAEKKYLILKDPSLETIYWLRSAELKALVARTRKFTQGDNQRQLDRIATLNRHHGDTFRREVALVKENHPDEAVLLSQDRENGLMNELTQATTTLQKTAETDIHSRLNRINAEGEKSSRTTMILSTFSLTAGLLLAVIITFNISRPLAQLKRATGAIAEGQFDYPVNIVRDDEIGSLAMAFRSMKERLKILETKLRDESPLTGLPGNRAIEEAIKSRLLKKKRFSLCHVDLDHFKPFADKYGYAWGSEVIKEVANILREQLRSAEGQDDFIGHVGGDDFIVIADPARAEEICRTVIGDFDSRTARFYSKNDRETGFIVGKDRQGIFRKFPLITITIAIVTDDGTLFQNSLDMAQKAAELKEMAKTLKGNNVVKLEEMESLFG